MGLPYNAPMGAVLGASFAFWQNGVRTPLLQYNMTPSTNGVWDLQLGEAQPGVTYPLVQNISFDLASSTFAASCLTSPDTPVNASTPCANGSYNIDTYLDITTNNTLTNNVTELRGVDSVWHYTDGEDAPNYILCDGEPNKSLSNTAMLTAVVKPGSCFLLKVCMARDPGADLMAAIGLTLMQVDNWSSVCSTPNSN